MLLSRVVKAPEHYTPNLFNKSVTFETNCMLIKTHTKRQLRTRLLYLHSFVISAFMYHWIRNTELFGSIHYKTQDSASYLHS